MIIGEIRSQIDTIWDAFWSGGIANPVLDVTILLPRTSYDPEHRGAVLERPAHAIGGEGIRPEPFVTGDGRGREHGRGREVVGDRRRRGEVEAGVELDPIGCAELSRHVSDDRPAVLPGETEP